MEAQDKAMLLLQLPFDPGQSFATCFVKFGWADEIVFFYAEIWVHVRRTARGAEAKFRAASTPVTAAAPSGRGLHPRRRWRKGRGRCPNPARRTRN